MKDIILKKWEIENDRVRLSYSDGTEFYVKKKDFNRAFGTILNNSKEDIKRDFEIK